MENSITNFPALAFGKHSMLTVDTQERLTTCSKVALRNGYFNGLLVVDSAGKAQKIKSARKVCGVGPFWGYNIFLNQRIKVELELEGEPFNMPLEEVKKLVFKNFKNWFGWRTRGDFDELKAKVRSASSIQEVIELIK